jgi:hypothetical protein
VSIIGAKGGAAAVYEIGHSLRLRAAASASLSTTGFTSGGTPNKLTFSTRIKRGKLGYQALVVTYSDANNIGAFYINANDRIQYYNWQAGAFTVNKESVAVFRDLSAHYHFVLIIDTTLATAEDRFQIWVNGVRITSWTTNTNTHTQNAGQMIGYAAGGVTQRIGVNPDGTTFNDAYFSDIHYLWGNKAGAADFGQLDENGVWVPKKPTGITYGAYGAYLDFSNGSSTTTLGYDKNGVNNWTCNNVSLTAGVTYDWMTDTPTNNHCLVDALTPSSNNAAASDSLLSLSAAAGANAYLGRRGNFVMTSGKWYWEVNMGIKDAAAGSWYLVGIIANAHPWPSSSNIGSWNGGYAYYNNASKANSDSYSAYGASFTNGDVIGVAFDVDAGTLEFYKNGTSQGQAFSGISGSIGFVPAFEFYRSTGTAQYMYPNFGQRPFSGTPPVGFKALCTANRAYAAMTTSGSFTGNAAADGPFVWLNGNPESMTINGNAVTWGTHADKTAGGFKLRTSSASYNASGSNTYSVTSSGKPFGDDAHAPNTAKGNP